MSTLLKAIALSAFTFTAICAMAAEPPADPSLETINVVTVTSAKYRITPDEFLYLAGTYGFDNGAVLKFRQTGLNQYTVSLTGLPDTEVHALSGNRFAAKDKSIHMVFAPHGNGSDTQVTVQYKNPNAVAQQGWATPEYLVATSH